MIEQLLLQEESRTLLELMTHLDLRQKAAGRETQELNLQIAAMVQTEALYSYWTMCRRI